MRAIFLLAAALLLAWLPSQASGDPLAAVTVTLPPADQGDLFSTHLRPVEDLPRPYVEEEYFISGEVDVFTYPDPPVPGELLLRDDVETAYTTRILIRRPKRAHKFKGTLVVEWMNSTAGFDTEPAWDPSSEYFARSGVIWVGVTNSPTAIDFLASGCGLFGILPEMCGTRYETLFMPEIGQAYEMVSQIVTLLRSKSPENPLPAPFRIERVFHVGQSQQGGSILTYANEFHFALNDGYFIQAAGSRARSLSTDAPNFAPGEEGRLVNTHLPVPVIRAQTETDMSGVIASDSRQEDTPSFRYYEMAGTSHSPVHENIEVIPAGVFGDDPIFLEDLCAVELNTLADGPVFGKYLYNAMWRNLELWVRRGVQPPHGDLIAVEQSEVARDEFGNALGGIRLPAMDVPIASYGPNNSGKPVCDTEGAPDPPDCTNALLSMIGNLACGLSGTTMHFDEELLAELYPRHWVYIVQVLHRAQRLRRDRFLLHRDYKELVKRAMAADVGQRGGPRPRPHPHPHPRPHSDRGAPQR